MSAAHARAGRIGALAKWGRTTDRAAATDAARTAAESRWASQVRAEHPDLDERIVQQMADARRREHMARISAKGVAARRRRAAA